ncbi:glycosyltransferase [Streptomyces sp. HUAS TT11]|uniref:glycosyltransferase n=1 Tax=Streptomyces sp. HUAS TT11 TaxID=3447508 RepID=UPI003F6572A5
MIKRLRTPGTGEVLSSGTRTTGPRPDGTRPHMIYLAIGFPPAAKSCAYRMRETANQFVALGWDVTVLTIAEESWEREYGLDHTLSDPVDPRVRIVELPLAREDLETDIRRFTEQRALSPVRWAKQERERHLEHFPELVFGGWRGALEQGLLDIHRELPADLLVASCAPYVNLAAAWKLWETHKVPYAIDFRDGWSVDVIGGGEAFTRDSEAGRWEERVLSEAVAVWCVNDPIADFYRERYPRLAERVHVVRNGFDPDSVPAAQGIPDPEKGLTFGYLGSVNFKPSFLATVLDGWRTARERDPLVARSRFEIRGHIGAGASREANDHMKLIRQAEADGVLFGGPVPKAEVAGTYGRWDALVLMLVGGRFVTSGKVYEFMASGLPVVSAHEVDHDASTVLEGHPLWTGACGLDEEGLADAFVRAARMAVEATDEQRADARAHAARFTRGLLMAPGARHLTETVRPPRLAEARRA